MNLKKLKQDIEAVKKTVGVDEEPTVRNFNKWCEKYHYHRPVDPRETLFRNYVIPEYGEVESDPVKYLLLSHEYFTIKHGVENEIVSGEHGWMWRCCLWWWHKYRFNVPFNVREAIKDEEYQQWFSDKWNKFLSSHDLDEFYIPEPDW